MNLWRALVCLLLSLTLMMRGVAANPTVPSLSGNSGITRMGAVPHMPCHEAIKSLGQNKGHQPSCCDQTCPDMRSCALGQPATLSSAPTVFFGASAHALAPRATLTATAIPKPVFRPPIALHC
jgi:hypothetical protein